MAVMVGLVRDAGWRFFLCIGDKEHEEQADACIYSGGRILNEVYIT